jgi:ribosome-binding factor A
MPVGGGGTGASMSHRMGRLANIIRDVVSDAIANRVWDPRVSRFTSVTRVELSPDMRIANVFVSVMGTDAEATRTMQGLQSARGMVQTRVAQRLDIRICPSLRFHLDVGIKAAIETFRQLQEVVGGQPEDRGGPEEIEPDQLAPGPAGDEPEPGAKED